MGPLRLSLFFVFSKVLWLVATPSNLLVGLTAIAALATVSKRGRLAVTAAGCAFALGLACGVGPVGNMLTAPLESQFEPFPANGPAPDGIIVLGGAVDETLSFESGRLQLNEAGERILALLELARRYPDAQLFFSGGSGILFNDLPMTEADVVAREIGTLGLTPGRLAIENRSFNTRENAVESARLLQPRPGQRWLLVTSAFHMPRAIGCFRVAGFDVTAYPVDLRTGGHMFALSAAASDGLRRTEVALREWIGLVAYRLAGYTDAFLPGPSETK